MKKIDLGQTFGLLANVGVLAGIVFLGIEIRQNTNVARASAYRENVQDIAEWRTLLAVNPDLARIQAMYADRAVSELDSLELDRLSYLLSNLFSSYENAYYATRFGVIRESEWQRFEIGACLQVNLIRESGIDSRALNAELISPFITEEFRAHLLASC